MPVIVGPPIKKIYVELIKQAIADLGRQVSIYLPPEEADCPNCIWSPTEKTSTNKFDTSFVASVQNNTRENHLQKPSDVYFSTSLQTKQKTSLSQNMAST